MAGTAPTRDREWTRREFLGATLAAGGAVVSGCARNPVSGRRQWMLVTEAQEIRMDNDFAPHQFSADYGALRDPALQAYLSGIGENLAARSHRPHMPYSFRAVHASYVNAYTFPAGSVAVTRGILLDLPSEAALAGLLGHEIGHVTARHGAERMSKGLLAQLMVVGLGAAVAAKDERYAPLAVGLGAVASGVLLAKYSRMDEREADELGMQYMVKAGYNPSGMVELMDLLRALHKRKPNALERMFASHPMSDSRHGDAARRLRDEYTAPAADFPTHRERYLDMTAGLRARRNLVEAVQQGDEAMLGGRWDDAVTRYQTALKNDEADYEALLKLAKVHLARNRAGEARALAERARAAYPEEPQALQVRGMAALRQRAYEPAARDFDAYSERLPGNPMPQYFAGRAYEGLGNRPLAIERYRSFLAQVTQGEEAEYARKKLIEWKVIKPPTAS